MSKAGVIYSGVQKLESDLDPTVFKKRHISGFQHLREIKVINYY